MKRLFIDGVTKRSRKVSDVNPRVSIDLEQYVRQVVASIGSSGGGNYTFESGLTEIAGTVKLGGVLNDYADIDGDLGTQSTRFMNMQAFSAETDNPLSDYTYHMYLNNSVPTGYVLNGFSNMGLAANKKSSVYGAGYFLTEDGIDPRPYIVSEMSYGGGAARTAKVEFSNDYLLSSHKVYDVTNPTGAYKEYLTRLGDSELSLESINVDLTDPNNLSVNIINGFELSQNGIKMYSASSTGTPTFEYIFPITSLSKPIPQTGHSMVLNSTGNQFDFVKDYKCLGQSLFAVGETVTNKTILLVAPFNNYILESISIISPTGIGSFDLTIQKLSETQTFNLNAVGSVLKVNTGSIATPIVNNEVISIAVTNVVTSMTQLSVTLNFLYAG